MFPGSDRSFIANLETYQITDRKKNIRDLSRQRVKKQQH